MNATSKLTWKNAPISSKQCADTGGFGRFMIHPRGDGRYELRLNTFYIGTFIDIATAKARAEVSFAALVPTVSEVSEGEV
jgi:hypothetical protein